MIKFKKKKNRFWYSPIVLFILLAVLVFFSFSIWGLFERYQQTTQLKKIAKEEYEQLSERIEDLNQDISELSTEEGKEGIIRVKYQVAKEGEKVLSIVEENQSAQEEEEGESEKLRKSFFDFLKDFFRKKN